MRPVRFFSRGIPISDPLHVQRLVDVFEQTKAHDAIVGTLVFDERGCAKFGGAGIRAVGSRGVEDLVDTGSSQ